MFPFPVSDPINWYQEPVSTWNLETPTLPPQLAPEDPTLPLLWKGVIDGFGRFYYWNTETNTTQVERPWVPFPYPYPSYSSDPFPPTPVTASSAYTSHSQYPHFNPTYDRPALPAAVVQDCLSQLAAIQQSMADYHNTCQAALHQIQERSALLFAMGKTAALMEEMRPAIQTCTSEPPAIIPKQTIVSLASLKATSDDTVVPNDTHTQSSLNPLQNSVVSHRISPYETNFTSGSNLSPTHGSVVCGATTTTTSKLIQVSQLLKPRSEVKMKRKPLPQPTRCRQTRIQSDSETTRCGSLLTIFAEPNDLAVPVAAVSEKHEFIVPETETPKGPELDFDELWADCGGLPTTKLAFTSLYKPGLMFKYCVLVHDKDHLLEDKKQSTIVHDFPQLLPAEANYSMHYFLIGLVGPKRTIIALVAVAQSKALIHVLEPPIRREWLLEHPDALFLALQVGEKVYVKSAEFGKLRPDPFIPSKLFSGTSYGIMGVPLMNETLNDFISTSRPDFVCATRRHVILDVECGKLLTELNRVLLPRGSLVRYVTLNGTMLLEDQSLSFKTKTCDTIGSYKQKATHTTSALMVVIATSCRQLTYFVVQREKHLHLSPFMVAVVQCFSPLTSNNEPIFVVSQNERPSIYVLQMSIQRAKAEELFNCSRVIPQPLSFPNLEAVDFLQIHSESSSSRYFSGSFVLMTMSATRSVVHLFLAWLLCTFDEKNTCKPALTTTILNAITVLLGGSYTKAVDVRRDLFGTIGYITVHDPKDRDLVPDNAENIAGMGSPLIGPYVESSYVALVVVSISSFGFNLKFTPVWYSIVVSSMGIFVCLPASLYASNLITITDIRDIEPVLQEQLMSSIVLRPMGIPIIGWVARPSSLAIPKFRVQNIDTYIDPELQLRVEVHYSLPQEAQDVIEEDIERVLTASANILWEYAHCIIGIVVLDFIIQLVSLQSKNQGLDNRYGDVSNGNYCSHVSCCPCFIDFIFTWSVESSFVETVAINCEYLALVYHHFFLVPLQSNVVVRLLLSSAIVHSFVIFSHLLHDPIQEASRVFSAMQNLYCRQSTNTSLVSAHLCALVHLWQVEEDGIVFFFHSLDKI